MKLALIAATSLRMGVATLFPFFMMMTAATVAHADTMCGAAPVGGRVTVNENTSCAFGFNVLSAFLNSRGGQVVAYSPVTGQSYVMNCVQLLHRVQCRGGDDAVVELW
jgi:hypothetical protein